MAEKATTKVLRTKSEITQKLWGHTYAQTNVKISRERKVKAFKTDRTPAHDVAHYIRQARRYMIPVPLNILRMATLLFLCFLLSGVNVSAQSIVTVYKPNASGLLEKVPAPLEMVIKDMTKTDYTFTYTDSKTYPVYSKGKSYYAIINTQKGVIKKRLNMAF